MALADACQIKPPKSEARTKLSADAEVSFLPMEDLGVESRIVNATQRRPLAAVVGSYTYFADGDVLLAKITPCFENGKLGIVSGLTNGIGFGSSEYHVLRPTSVLLKEWLYYFLSRDSFREEGAARMTGAVGHRRVPKEFIETCSIPVPPLVEQERIVGILDEAFECIATAKANASQNLRNARALFESRLQSVFSQHHTEWLEHNEPLSELCELIVDCEHKTAPTQAEGVPSIRTPNIGKGKLLLDDVNRVSEETYRVWTRRAEPRAGDLILAREAPAGNVCVIPENTRVCLGQRTVLIRPKADTFDSYFLSLRLLDPTMQAKLLAHSRGATVQHVNLKDIRALHVGAIPPLNIQRRIADNFASIADEADRLVGIYESKLAVLESLKKSLLHQAFKGQL
jgi:type I restriction enzyme S subunit